MPGRRPACRRCVSFALRTGSPKRLSSFWDDLKPIKSSLSLSLSLTSLSLSLSLSLSRSLYLARSLSRSLAPPLSISRVLLTLADLTKKLFHFIVHWFFIVIALGRIVSADCTGFNSYMPRMGGVGT